MPVSHTIAVLPQPTWATATPLAIRANQPVRLNFTSAAATLSSLPNEDAVIIVAASQPCPAGPADPLNPAGGTTVVTDVQPGDQSAIKQTASHFQRWHSCVWQVVKCFVLQPSIFRRCSGTNISECSF